MHLCLFEDDHVPALRPLVEGRAAYDLRLGIRSVLETARDAFAPEGLALHARPLVAPVTDEAHDAPVNALPEDANVLFLNGRFVATGGAATSQIRSHVAGDGAARTFTHDGTLVAAWVPAASTHLPADLLETPALPAAPFSDLPTTSLEEATLLRRPWTLLDTLRPALHRDAAALAAGGTDAPLPTRPHASVHESVVAVRPSQITLGADVTVRPGAVLNAEDGPIVLGDGASVAERAVLRGPCYVGPQTQVKVGANIEGAAFGYWCKVAGEIHDTILHALTNKGHPGFLGHAYLGQWCNVGADTNNSNLRNDYGEVTAYAPTEGDFVPTGRQFAGLFMGDHSKCGINTMLDTGTVVGTCCNLYGGDFPPRYVPPFSWGSSRDGFTTYRLEKALSVAEHVMGRRDVPFTEADAALLRALHERTADERAAHHG
jgi:UDP-N-acetylglucosamine diphosphorylase/glucosamine-1-phosphate N-acetyltransferase